MYVCRMGQQWALSLAAVCMVLGAACSSGSGGGTPTDDASTGSGTGGSSTVESDGQASSGGSSSANRDAAPDARLEDASGSGGTTSGTPDAGDASAPDGSAATGGTFSTGGKAGTGGSGTGGTGGKAPVDPCASHPTIAGQGESGYDCGKVCGWTTGTRPAGYTDSASAEYCPSWVNCGDDGHLEQISDLARESAYIVPEENGTHGSTQCPASGQCQHVRTYQWEIAAGTCARFTTSTPDHRFFATSSTVCSATDACKVGAAGQKVYLFSELGAPAGWVRLEAIDVGGGGCPFTCP